MVLFNPLDHSMVWFYRIWKLWEITLPIFSASVSGRDSVLTLAYELWISIPSFNLCNIRYGNNNTGHNILFISHYYYQTCVHSPIVNCIATDLSTEWLTFNWIQLAFNCIQVFPSSSGKSLSLRTPKPLFCKLGNMRQMTLWVSCSHP